MKITRIEVVRSKPRALPIDYLPAWFSPDGRPTRSYQFSLYRVYTDEGIVGLGPHGGEPDGWVTNALIGFDPFAVERFFSRAMAGREMTLHRGSYGGLEVALWDIIGKAAGLPVYRLLGSYGDRVMAYAATSRLLSPEEHVDQVLQIREAGFKAVKLRLHRQDPADDLKVVEAVRRAVGDGYRIVVDANQNHKSMVYPHWTRRTALAMARELQRLGVYFLEEPLPRKDVAGLAELAASVEIPIAGGEHANDIYELREHLAAGAYDIFQPDVILGDMGISGTRKLAVIAEYFGKEIVPHVCGLGSFALNLPAMLQAVCTVSNCPMIEYPYDPPVLTVETQQAILKEPLVVDRAGMVGPPDRPGIGVELDEGELAG
jgi:D-galactarolactone cycloisomerase